MVTKLGFGIQNAKYSIDLNYGTFTAYNYSNTYGSFNLFGAWQGGDANGNIQINGLWEKMPDKPISIRILDNNQTYWTTNESKLSSDFSTIEKGGIAQLFNNYSPVSIDLDESKQTWKIKFHAKSLYSYDKSDPSNRYLMGEISNEFSTLNTYSYNSSSGGTFFDISLNSYYSLFTGISGSFSGQNIIGLGTGKLQQINLRNIVSPKFPIVPGKPVLEITPESIADKTEIVSKAIDITEFHRGDIYKYLQNILEKISLSTDMFIQQDDTPDKVASDEKEIFKVVVLNNIKDFLKKIKTIYSYLNYQFSYDESKLSNKKISPDEINIIKRFLNNLLIAFKQKLFIALPPEGSGIKVDYSLVKEHYDDPTVNMIASTLFEISSHILGSYNTSDTSNAPVSSSDRLIEIANAQSFYSLLYSYNIKTTPEDEVVTDESGNTTVTNTDGTTTTSTTDGEVVTSGTIIPPPPSIIITKDPLDNDNPEEIDPIPDPINTTISPTGYVINNNYLTDQPNVGAYHVPPKYHIGRNVLLHSTIATLNGDSPVGDPYYIINNCPPGLDFPVENWVVIPNEGDATKDWQYFYTSGSEFNRRLDGTTYNNECYAEFPNTTSPTHELLFKTTETNAQNQISSITFPSIEYPVIKNTYEARNVTMFAWAGHKHFGIIIGDPDAYNMEDTIPVDEENPKYLRKYLIY